MFKIRLQNIGFINKSILLVPKNLYAIKSKTYIWSAVYVNTNGNERKQPIPKIEDEIDLSLKYRIRDIISKEEQHPLPVGFDMLNEYFLPRYYDTIEYINVIDKELKKINNINPKRNVYVRRQTQKKDIPVNVKKYVKPLVVSLGNCNDKVNMFSRIWIKLIKNGKLRSQSDFMKDIKKKDPGWVFSKKYKSCPYDFLWPEIRKWNQIDSTNLSLVTDLIRLTQYYRVSDYSVANYKLLTARNIAFNRLKDDYMIITGIVDQLETDIGILRRNI